MADTYIPEHITVHLGEPDSDAPNIIVSFPEYIKNVASSELYPTWPENALEANIHAQISFALNRITDNHYKNQGYSFDITNSPTVDQSFVPNRNYYLNISRIVDGIFNCYIKKGDSKNPFQAKHCNGTDITCYGLSQWDTVLLADQGLNFYDILAYYYGDDIDIVLNAPISNNIPIYAEKVIEKGEISSDVRKVQLVLNRISFNFSQIPKILPIDGVFGEITYSAIKAFQRLFDLNDSGSINKSTWYKIFFIYNKIKRLSNLASDALFTEGMNFQYDDVISLEATGDKVKTVQHFLAVAGCCYSVIPIIETTGRFDGQTQFAVCEFQKKFNLEISGNVDEITWHFLYSIYLSVINSGIELEGATYRYPGNVLKVGMQSPYIAVLQQYLSYIANTFTNIKKVPVSGHFGTHTQRAVIQFQASFGLNQTGVAGPVTYNEIARVYSDLKVGHIKKTGQYPGYVLKMQY